MKKLQKKAIKNGTVDMSLEEINKEIIKVYKKIAVRNINMLFIKKL